MIISEDLRQLQLQAPFPLCKCTNTSSAFGVTSLAPETTQDASEPKHLLYQIHGSANTHLDLAKQLTYCITASKQGDGYGLFYPAFRVAPWCSMRSSLSLGSRMLSSQGTPFSNSVARVGFSPMVPPLNSRTPSTAFPSSLAGPPINPMSPTCACTHR